MENFEFEKSSYRNELKDVFFIEKISIYDYAMELGEPNIELISNPKNFGELNLVKRALEMFMKLREISKTEKFDPENNSAYTITYLIAKGLRNEMYFEYAAELGAHMQSTEYLRGKFIVDALCVSDEAVKSIIKYEVENSGVENEEEAMSFILKMSFAAMFVELRAAMICRENGFEMTKTQDEIEEGIPTYLHKNECALTYLREREMNTQENEYVKKYRIEKGI